jgi:protein-S-isoprenylcysteine O-methyltransferase Ste14
MSEQKQENAGVIAPPPLIYFGTLAVGLILHCFLPMTFLPSGINLILGALLIVLGLGIAFAAIVAMHRANTSPDPWEPTRTLVANGPFRFTRNPIYLAFALIYLGVTGALNALAALALFPIALAIIHFGVIAREEKYLARKFGETYVDYKSRVRRWI